MFHKIRNLHPDVRKKAKSLLTRLSTFYKYKINEHVKKIKEAEENKERSAFEEDNPHV